MPVSVPIFEAEVYPVSPGNEDGPWGAKIKFKEWDGKRWTKPKQNIVRDWSPEMLRYYLPHLADKKGMALKFALLRAAVDATKLHLPYKAKSEVQEERRRMRQMGSTKMTADVKLSDKSLKMRDLEKSLVEKLKDFTVDIPGGTKVKVLTKPPRPSKEPNAEKASITLIVDEKIYKTGKDFDCVTAQEAVRQKLMEALEECEGVEEVLKLEPTNPKDEGS